MTFTDPVNGFAQPLNNLWQASDEHVGTLFEETCKINSRWIGYFFNNNAMCVQNWTYVGNTKENGLSSKQIVLPEEYFS